MSDVTMRIADPVLESDSLRPVVERAAEWLKPILQGSPDPLTADWELARDMRTGTPYVALWVSGTEPRARSGGLYKPAELLDEDFASSSFRSLFAEVLRRRTHQLLRNLADPGGDPTPTH